MVAPNIYRDPFHAEWYCIIQPHDTNGFCSDWFARLPSVIARNACNAAIPGPLDHSAAYAVPKPARNDGAWTPADPMQHHKGQSGGPVV